MLPLTPRSHYDYKSPQAMMCFPLDGRVHVVFNPIKYGATPHHILETVWDGAYWLLEQSLQPAPRARGIADVIPIDRLVERRRVRRELEVALAEHVSQGTSV